ncbi:MAG: hypothetical protein QOF77_2247 [Solirubrobacteraceae bacterium]|nr:hypothetical protein [Solirubrobacteraceae bacterium]
MRRQERPRRNVPESAIVALRPIFRYSQTRQAHVLRIVGQRFGPVLKPRTRHEPSREGLEPPAG